LGCAFLASCEFGEVEREAPPSSLWYNGPATEWNEALPIGNGRLGAMLFGGPEVERIQFNQETLWTHGPRNYANDSAYFVLDSIRALLNQGLPRKAEELAMEHFMSDPLRQSSYQAFGDLYLAFIGHEDYHSYQRRLELNRGVVVSEYIADGVGITQESFSSYPDNVIGIRIRSDEEEALNLTINFDTPHESSRVTAEGNRLFLEVAVAMGSVRGAAVAEIRLNGGELLNVGERMEVRGASEVKILLSAATNFKSYDYLSGDSKEIVLEQINRISKKPFETIMDDHLEDYQTLYDRFHVSFGNSDRGILPTDERINKFWKEPDDPQLIALYMQYARYLLISSSRPGTEPATLQGIWNDSLEPPWDSKWTTNINTEMNYWPAEVLNLEDCHEPLFDLIDDVSRSGALVAQEHYNARGWVLHHNTDIWRGAAPINHANHGIWVSGGAWLCQHLWEHFLYGGDVDFLRERAYPLMKGSAMFFLDFLTENKDGALISSPSNSPEIGGLVAGPSMDHQIIRQLFRNCIQAAKRLNVDHEFQMELEDAIEKILPNQIGRLGQLQEWAEDIDDPEEHHRHVSHLWALHPGSEINWKETPELRDAAKTSLEMRGDEGTGWSLAWKVNFWARLLDGERAYKLLHMLLSPAEHPDRDTRGGSYPNLFDAHPPFQIDGNFGGAAGIAELLVQSHLSEIHLLPALPEALSSGSVSGLRTRGGFELAMSWSQGQLETLEILSTLGAECRLRYGRQTLEFETDPGVTYQMGQDFEILNP